MDYDRSAARLGLLRDFVAGSRGATELGQLTALYRDSIGALGIDHFLLTSHVDPGAPPPGTVALGNYPAEWVARARQNPDWRSDPVLSACERTGAGFFWRDLDRMGRHGPRERRIVANGAKFGLGDGFSVPNSVPGELFGSSHFVVGPGKRIELPIATLLQSLAAFGFEAARRLSRGQDRPLVAHAPLTARQRDCVTLVARGKSDAVIAALLGLSPKTVNEHVENAKRRYCVATRQQLVVRALFASQITFNEVLH